MYSYGEAKENRETARAVRVRVKSETGCPLSALISGTLCFPVFYTIFR